MPLVQKGDSHNIHKRSEKITQLNFFKPMKKEEKR